MYPLSYYEQILDVLVDTITVDTQITQQYTLCSENNSRCFFSEHSVYNNYTKIVLITQGQYDNGGKMTQTANFKNNHGINSDGIK